MAAKVTHTKYARTRKKGEESPVRAGNGNHRTTSEFEELQTGSIPTDIGHTLDPNPTLPSARLIIAQRTRGVPTMKSATTTQQPPLALRFEQAGASRGDSVARRRTLVGNPLNDEQRSNDLSRSSSCQTTRGRVGVVGKHEPESQRGCARIRSRWDCLRPMGQLPTPSSQRKGQRIQ